MTLQWVLILLADARQTQYLQTLEHIQYSISMFKQSMMTVMLS